MASENASPAVTQNAAPGVACPTSNPRNWPIFKNVDEALLSKIKLFHVFGECGASALFTTYDGEVYGLGYNKHCMLGHYDDSRFLKTPELLSFDEQRVRKFACGNRHMLALTESGKVFAWGNNRSGQLGIADPTIVRSKGFPTQILSGKVVIDVACGRLHSAAVTEDGQLFEWGLCYSGDTNPSAHMVSEPQLVKYAHGYPSKVKSVSCDVDSTYCISSVFLRLVSIAPSDYFTRKCFVVSRLSGTLERKYLPNDAAVHQISCGPAHCLAVTEKGKVASWGSNFEGQLGRIDAAASRSNAITIDDPDVVTGINQVIEVAAIRSLALSVALTCDGQIYVWGMGKKTPTLSTFKSIQDAFSHYSSPDITYETLVASHERSRTGIVRALQGSFDDEETSDIKFRVDGKFINVHRAILKIRCEYFRNMFQHHWKECSQDVIEIQNHSHPVYHAFLNYIYTDEITVTSVPELIELLELAHLVMEQELKRACELLLKCAVTVENAAQIYAAAAKFSCGDLELFCLHLAARNQRAVMTSDAFKSLCDDDLRNFVAGTVEK